MSYSQSSKANKANLVHVSLSIFTITCYVTFQFFFAWYLHLMTFNLNIYLFHLVFLFCSFCLVLLCKFLASTYGWVCMWESVLFPSFRWTFFISMFSQVFFIFFLFFICQPHNSNLWFGAFFEIIHIHSWVAILSGENVLGVFFFFNFLFAGFLVKYMPIHVLCNTQPTNYPTIRPAWQIFAFFLISTPSPLLRFFVFYFEPAYVGNLLLNGFYGFSFGRKPYLLWGPHTSSKWWRDLFNVASHHVQPYLCLFLSRFKPFIYIVVVVVVLLCCFILSQLVKKFLRFCICILCFCKCFKYTNNKLPQVNKISANFFRKQN